MMALRSEARDPDLQGVAGIRMSASAGAVNRVKPLPCHPCQNSRTAPPVPLDEASSFSASAEASVQFHFLTSTTEASAGWGSPGAVVTSAHTKQLT